MTAVRPILFSAPMVRALLAGTKTQTRRALKRQPAGEWAAPGRTACPHGLIRDQLWVRETFKLVGGGDPGVPIYRANWREDALARGLENVPTSEPKGWTPSIFMPRWASRLTLAIEGVRVERLQSISNADVEAEGVIKVGRRWEVEDLIATPFSPQDAYEALWNSINGPGSWDSNPWVWVVEFKRVQT